MVTKYCPFTIILLLFCLNHSIVLKYIDLFIYVLNQKRILWFIFEYIVLSR